MTTTLIVIYKKYIIWYIYVASGNCFSLRILSINLFVKGYDGAVCVFDGCLYITWPAPQSCSRRPPIAFDIGPAALVSTLLRQRRPHLALTPFEPWPVCGTGPYPLHPRETPVSNLFKREHRDSFGGWIQKYQRLANWKTRKGCLKGAFFRWSNRSEDKKAHAWPWHAYQTTTKHFNPVEEEITLVHFPTRHHFTTIKRKVFSISVFVSRFRPLPRISREKIRNGPHIFWKND